MNPAARVDLGTPASTLDETVTMEIDGLPATVKPGTTVMRAARESGVDVPKLCATDDLKTFRSCRLCVVEIEGRSGVSFKFLDEVGSAQWPCNETAPMRTPGMHIDQFVRGKGLFIERDYVPTEERTNRKFPLLLTTGRPLMLFNVGAQTRRTPNVIWYREDLLEIHPHDAETRGISEGDRVSLTSRKGEITLGANITGLNGRNNLTSARKNREKSWKRPEESPVSFQADVAARRRQKATVPAAPSNTAETRNTVCPAR